jgi:hypothetical protein
MNDDELIELFRSYEYKPHSLLYPEIKHEFKSSLKHLCLPTATTITNEGNRIELDSVVSAAYKLSLSYYYNSLDTKDRIRFLGLLSVDIHELTHHIDFMTSPFGVNFHTKALGEYIAFQQFVPELLKHPEFIIDGRRLLDFDDLLSSKNSDFDLIKRWNFLKNKIGFFDAYFGSSTKVVSKFPSNIWPSNINPSYPLFDERFDIVSVNDFMLTFKIPGEKDYFLRPTTILEARGLANSLRWILFQLGYSKQSFAEIVNYLNTYYPSRDILPDYKFLLDLFFQKIGDINIDDYSGLQNVDAKGLDWFLYVISGLCWYALQAPPPTYESSLPNSSPVFRLLLAMRVLQNYYVDECKKMLYGEGIALLMHEFSNHVDDIFGDVVYNLPLHEKLVLPIDKILRISLEIIKGARRDNMLYVVNPQIRQHFDRIFRIQKYQLEKRLRKNYGYFSLVAMPRNGNPLWDIDDDTDIDQLLPAYRPPNNVLTWFQFRDNFVFRRFLKAEMIRAKLEQIFGTLGGSPPALKIDYEILNTIEVNYTIDTDGGAVYLIVDDYFLPKYGIVDDRQTAIVEHRIANYIIRNHLILHVELIIRGTSQFRKFNIILCPLRVIEDDFYKRKIECLMPQSMDPQRHKHAIKKARIRLINTTTEKILKYDLTLQSIRTTNWYRELMQLKKSGSDLSDRLNTPWLCSYCRNRQKSR